MKICFLRGLPAGISALFVSLLFVSQLFISKYSFANAATACKDVAEVTENVNSSTCFQFVKGFLEGALLSDAQIMKNLDTSKEVSAFTERAMRTRLGQTRDSLPPATLLADFCLPESKASDEVVFIILEALKKVQNKQDISSALIYENIKREFSCG